MTEFSATDKTKTVAEEINEALVAIQGEWLPLFEQINSRLDKMETTVGILGKDAEIADLKKRVADQAQTIRFYQGHKTPEQKQVEAYWQQILREQDEDIRQKFYRQRDLDYDAIISKAREFYRKDLRRHIEDRIKELSQIDPSNINREHLSGQFGALQFVLAYLGEEK